MLSAFWRYLVCEKREDVFNTRSLPSWKHTTTTLCWHHWEGLQLSWPGWCLNTLQSPTWLLSSSSGLIDKGSAENVKQMWVLKSHLSNRQALISSWLSPRFAGNKPFWPAGPWCHQAWQCSRAALCGILGHLLGPEPFWHGSGWPCPEEGCTWPGSPWSPSCIQSSVVTIMEEQWV